MKIYVALIVQKVYVSFVNPKSFFYSNPIAVNMILILLLLDYNFMILLENLKTILICLQMALSPGYCRVIKDFFSIYSIELAAIEDTLK